MSQTIQLNQLLGVYIKLKHPEFPNAAKGLEGMIIAHNILKNKEATGILIGGLSEAVWNRQRKKEELDKHKDVDVAILDEKNHIGRFEGGIDWWHPKKEKVTVTEDFGKIENLERKYYENCNKVKLLFDVEKYAELNPGLYIPHYEYVLDMRETEAITYFEIKNPKAELDEDVIKKFREKTKKRIGTKLPKFVTESFKEYILPSPYEQVKIKIGNIETRGLES